MDAESDLRRNGELANIIERAMKRYRSETHDDRTMRLPERLAVRCKLGAVMHMRLGYQAVQEKIAAEIERAICAAGFVRRATTDGGVSEHVEVEEASGRDE